MEVSRLSVREEGGYRRINKRAVERSSILDSKRRKDRVERV